MIRLLALESAPVLDYESGTWAYWDDVRDGRKDAPGNIQMLPKGFLWACCGQDGSSMGCKFGVHRSQPNGLRMVGGFHHSCR